MSYQNALKTLDFLLEVLTEADKPAPQQSKTEQKRAPSSDLEEKFFESVEDDGVEEGKTVKVTVNAKRLDAMWEEAELGENDDKGMYLGAIGKVMEIEEDDDTVQMRWVNLDTCWIPIKACVDSNGAEPTLPNGNRILSNMQKTMTNWSQLKTKLMTHLTQRLAGSDKMGTLLPSVTNPIPFNTSQQQLREWQRLHSILHESITNIVRDFNTDKEMQSMINLSESEWRIIHACKSHQYHVGSFRPDLLIQRDTQQTKICEINARFVSNGYLITTYLSNTLHDISTNNEFMGYPFPTVQQFFDQHLDFNKPVFIIKGREYGNDIHLLRLTHPDTVHIIHKDVVTWDPQTNALFTSDTHLRIEQVLLELHQDEILSLSAPILHKFCEMIGRKKLLNDFRTIFIVHNKKFLNILANPDIMSRYLDTNDMEFLHSFLIKSYDKLDLSTKHILDHVIEHKNEFILKPVLLGKGEGIIFGDECTDEEWYNSIQTRVLDQDTCMVQEHIDQEIFEFKSVMTDEWVQQNIVATLLLYNDIFYGPGVNRSSPSRLIAVARGGEILLPHVVDDEIVNSKNFKIAPLCNGD